MLKKLLLIAAILSFTAAPAFAGDAANGATLFQKYCKACHGKTGEKSQMSKAIKPSSKEVVIAALDGKSEGLNKNYKMMTKIIAKKNLTDEQKDDLAAFLAE